MLFKIYEKVKSLYEKENNLLAVLGEEVLKRVTNLKKHCDEKIGDYGLASTERYFDEKVNPSIKKYKSVIREYYRKYYQEIKTSSTAIGNVKSIMKEFLERKCVTFKENDELVMGFWMIEYFKLSRDTPKS